MEWPDVHFSILQRAFKLKANFFAWGGEREEGGWHGRGETIGQGGHLLPPPTLGPEAGAYLLLHCCPPEPCWHLYMGPVASYRQRFGSAASEARGQGRPGCWVIPLISSLAEPALGGGRSCDPVCREGRGTTGPSVGLG